MFSCHLVLHNPAPNNYAAASIVHNILVWASSRLWSTHSHSEMRRTKKRLDYPCGQNQLWIGRYRETTTILSFSAHKQWRWRRQRQRLPTGWRRDSHCGWLGSTEGDRWGNGLNGWSARQLLRRSNWMHKYVWASSKQWIWFQLERFIQSGVCGRGVLSSMMGIRWQW